MTGPDLAAARRPWSALPVYAAVLLLAVLYQFGDASAATLSNASTGTFARAWHTALAAASLTAAVSVLAPPRRVLAARTAECIAASVLAIELGVYVAALAGKHHVPWATVCLGLGVVGVCAARAGLAMWERWRILQTLVVLDAGRREANR